MLEQLEIRNLLSFAPPAFFDVGASPFGLAAADFNQDGKLDVVTGNMGSTNASLLLGKGNGTFFPAININVGLKTFYASVTDFNGDQHLDIVFGAEDNAAVTMLGDGTGGFIKTSVVYPFQGPGRLTTGDFNNDNLPDIAIPSTGLPFVQKVKVYFGKGDGTFPTATEFDIGTGYGYAASGGDVNDDGNLDVVVADALWGGVRMTLGNGNGTFKGTDMLWTTGSCTDVRVADFNGDGVLDLVSANQGTVSIFMGNGDATFRSPVNYNAGPGAYSVAVSDFDSDGSPDLVTANPNNDTVSVLKGNGDGTFESAVSYPAGSVPGTQTWWVEVGNFNRDASPDIVVTNRGSNQLALLRNLIKPQATHFSIRSTPLTTAGNLVRFTVTALTGANTVAASYDGTVHFTSTDFAAVLPSDYTFTPGDEGVHTFLVSLHTAGNQTISVTDTLNTTLTGDHTVNVNPASAVSLAVADFPSPVAAGTVNTFSVTAKDAYGNTATDYLGTVTFTSSDSSAIIPVDYTFKPGDQGHRIFGAVLFTPGFQSLTATDTANGTIDGTQTNIEVIVPMPPGRNASTPAITSVDREAFVISPGEALTLDVAFMASMVRHGALIDWGDGNGSTTMSLPAGVRSFTATHVYSAADDYQITITVAANDGTGADTLLLTTDPAALAPAAGLVDWWTGDGNHQTAAPDIAGSNGGTMVGNTTHSAGLVGRAFRLDGDGDYVGAGDSNTLRLTRQGTLSAWIYPTGTGSCYSSEWCAVILNKEGEYTFARFVDGSIGWGFANVNPGWQWVDTEYVAPLNQWTYLAIAYDNGMIRTYANGELVHTFNGFGEIGDDDPTQNELRIGGRQYIEQNFSGLIDEVQIYRRALSGDEVRAIFDVGSAGQVKGVRVLDSNLFGSDRPELVVSGYATLANARGDSRYSLASPSVETVLVGSGTVACEIAVPEKLEVSILVSAKALMSYTSRIDRLDVQTGMLSDLILSDLSQPSGLRHPDW